MKIIVRIIISLTVSLIIGYIVVSNIYPNKKGIELEQGWRITVEEHRNGICEFIPVFDPAWPFAYIKREHPEPGCNTIESKNTTALIYDAIIWITGLGLIGLLTHKTTGKLLR